MICAGSYRIKTRRVADVWRLYALGDMHLGNSGCATDRLQEDIARIKADPCGRVLLMGDLADYVGPADKRWDACNITEDAKVKDLGDWGTYLSDLVVKTLRPIRGKLIGALSGNHEHVFAARQAQQCHAAACKKLGVRDFGYSCFFDLCFARVGNGQSRRAYRIFAHHGAGAAQSPGGKINRLAAFMNMCEADVYLVGHVHERDVKTLDVLAADRRCTRLISRKRLGVFSGTYLKTYAETAHAGYGERAGYRPVPLGCSVVEFQPFTHTWCHRTESVSARVAI